VTDDLNLAVKTGVSHDHRTNDLLVDHSMDDGLTTVANLCLRMNGTDDRNLDVSRANRSCVRRDRKMDVNLDGNLYRHTNVMDDRNDLTMVVSLDVSRANRNYVRHDLNLDAMLDASHDHRMNDLLVDPNLDVMTDVSSDEIRDLRMNDPLVYRKTDVNLLSHNCVRRDLKMDENSDVKNLHVMYY
jgi:hypothetical protein